MLELKHLQFFPSHSNQTHTLQKFLQTIRIYSHFQNKPYKTTPSILSDFTIPDEHHTIQTQYQNRKRIKGIFLHSVPPYFWGFFPYHLLFFCSPSHLDIILKSMSFHKTEYAETPFPTTFFPQLLSHQLTKIISTFIQSKVFNKTWYIWLNPLLPVTPLSSVILSCSSFAY